MVVLGAAQLTQPIPLAVLAGIALFVGFNILDWSFLKRAHRVSWQTTFIMYGVMLLTVFVDLIVAVGVGVFIANILTIERLSELQAQNVKAISDADDDVPLTDEERDLLDQAQGQVLLFYLSGPMIFGVAKAIARQHNALGSYAAVVIDLRDVPLLDVTVSLAIENAIKDSVNSQRAVFLVCTSEQAKYLIEGLGLAAIIPRDHILTDRTEALRLAHATLPEREPELV